MGLWCHWAGPRAGWGPFTSETFTVPDQVPTSRHSGPDGSTQWSGRLPPWSGGVSLGSGAVAPEVWTPAGGDGPFSGRLAQAPCATGSGVTVGAGATGSGAGRDRLRFRRR